ncbi:MAG: putative CDP-diacylglycerol--glycerol-3-phosphate 3-phosphatidyl-transferase 2 [Candidatus Dependentiae bacterium ADurb.Bin331]|nr:MAG: putative CDP-diacylglycerol--glycerol-3-phosphate 3-phosphatidyl-transferase 2 [Candidatus Dependentiae bacterium ADurb.Bin331]
MINFFNKLPPEQRKITTASIFTLMRIGLIPFIVYAFLGSLYTVALLLIASALVTDFVDGMIARLFKQRTVLGALLDPLADKLLMGALVTLFTFSTQLKITLPFWFWLLFMTKEFLLIVGTSLVIANEHMTKIKAQVIGKIAMGAQTLLICTLCLQLLNIPLDQFIIDDMLIFTTVAMVVAFYSYAKQAFAFRSSSCVQS